MARITGGPLSLAVGRVAGVVRIGVRPEDMARVVDGDAVLFAVGGDDRDARKPGCVSAGVFGRDAERAQPGLPAADRCLGELCGPRADLDGGPVQVRG
jgi:hypothetical protein